MIARSLLRLLAWFVSKPAIANWLIRRAMRRPYTHIYKDGDLYMGRWWLFNPYPESHTAEPRKWQFPLSARIHYIRRGDDDRHYHDHPWPCAGIILRGGYMESRPEPIEDMERFCVYTPGDVNTLRPGDYHRIEAVSRGTMTLFITGRYLGTWGFLVNGVKVPWREYRNTYKKEENAN